MKIKIVLTDGPLDEMTLQREDKAWHFVANEEGVFETPDFLLSDRNCLESLLKKLQEINKIKALDLSGNDIYLDEENLELFTDVILNNSDLEILNLSDNNLDADNTLPLCEILKDARKLQILDLAFNKFDRLDIDLYSIFSEHPNLKNLLVSYNLPDLSKEERENFKYSIRTPAGEDRFPNAEVYPRIFTYLVQENRKAELKLREIKKQSFVEIKKIRLEFKEKHKASLKNQTMLLTPLDEIEPGLSNPSQSSLPDEYLGFDEKKDKITNQALKAKSSKSKLSSSLFSSMDASLGGNVLTSTQIEQIAKIKGFGKNH